MIVTFFDCETTGKLSPDNRIIEASFRTCDSETQLQTNEFLARFNPERNVDAGAVRVHGITNEDVKKEPIFKIHMPAIKKILQTTNKLVAHNLEGFDLPMLKAEFERCEEPLPEFETFDTMLKGNFCTDLGKSPTLAELCFSLDIVYDPDSAHSAAYDTEVLRDAFFNAVRFGWFTI